MALPPKNFMQFVDGVWKKAAGPTQSVPSVKTKTPVQVAGTNKSYADQTAYKASRKLKKTKIPKDKI